MIKIKLVIFFVYFEFKHSYYVFIADSPYGDVSGIPDPYNGGQIEDPHNQMPQTPTHFYNGHHGQQMSFEDAIDGSGQNGYITPNAKSKRIVREIIV